MGLPLLLSLIIQLSGTLIMLSGLFLICNGWWSLRNNISIFVIPGVNHYIITEGLSYGHVRHPIYGGLMLLCLGYAISVNSVEKMVITLILSFLLVSEQSCIVSLITHSII